MKDIYSTEGSCFFVASTRETQSYEDDEWF